MDSKERVARLQQYYEAVQGGMEPRDAFFQAFPDGVPQPPTPEEQAEAAQKAQLGGVAGVIGGSLATKYLYDNLFKEGAKAAATEALPSVVAPNVLGASPVGAATPGIATGGGANALAPSVTPGSGLTGMSGLPIANQLLGGAGVAAGAYVGSKQLEGAKELLEDGDTSLMNHAALFPLTGGLSALAAPLGLDRKTTKDYQAERWGELMDNNVQFADVAYKANHGGGDTWDSGKYAGEKWSFDKALDLASEDPTHFQHVLGNYETFGDKYGALDDTQQKSLVGALVGQGLYNSEKGDVRISDADRAMATYESMFGAPSQPQAPQAPAPAPLPGPTPSQLFNADKDVREATMLGQTNPGALGITPTLSREELESLNFRPQLF